MGDLVDCVDCNGGLDSILTEGKMDAPFSELILMGIPMIPARKGTWISYDSSGRPCAACAIGTGLIAGGKGSFDLCEIALRWPVLNKRVIHPVSKIEHSLWYVASNFFEEHGWSREEVAAFIAEKEREDEQEKKAAVKEGAEVAG